MNTDPSLELRDIKPAVDIPEIPASSWPLWATLALLALGLAAAAFVIWKWRARRNIGTERTASQLALQQLAQIKESSTAADRYAMEVSTILRNYIESHFKIAATHQTTEEFLQGISQVENRIDAAQRSVLAQFLTQCDEVKFARGQLDQSQRDRLHDVAHAFVQTTTDVQAEPETPATGAILQPSH